MPVIFTTVASDPSVCKLKTGFPGHPAVCHCFKSITPLSSASQVEDNSLTPRTAPATGQSEQSGPVHSDERSSQRAQNTQRAKTAGRDWNDGQRRSHRADKGGNENRKSHGQIPL
ncbi:hypothetical protein NQZ68_003518 [Dissostichus eleginoides]|nr:hypothetical protein NQZ68_003518 [Dissostichus eleginoides]